jgi:secondary thiamine-phosphate synthase enzyme
VKHFFYEISVTTKRPIEFIDVTDRVCEAVGKSGIKNGIASIFSNHTTASVRINERCSRLQMDMEALLAEIVPADRPYRHNETTADGRGNAHSHLMSMIMGGSETVPVKGGRLHLGTWQSVFFIELDGPRGERRLTVTVVGV